MIAAIGQSLPVAIGLLLAAAPMVILAVVLVTKRPLSVSYAFLSGWVAGLIVVGAIVLAVADAITLADEPAWWATSLKLVLGAVLIFMAVQKWMGRPRSGDDPKVPKWMAAADTMTAAKASLLGFVLAAANPKNLVLVVAGAAVIADATPQAHQQIMALIVFVVVASLGLATPVIVRTVLGARSDRILAVTDDWMTRNNAAIMSVVLLVLGVVLIFNGIIGLRATR